MFVSIMGSSLWWHYSRTLLWAPSQGWHRSKQLHVEAEWNFGTSWEQCRTNMLSCEVLNITTGKAKPLFSNKALKHMINIFLRDCFSSVTPSSLLHFLICRTIETLGDHTQVFVYKLEVLPWHSWVWSNRRAGLLQAWNHSFIT